MCLNVEFGVFSDCGYVFFSKFIIQVADNSREVGCWCTMKQPVFLWLKAQPKTVHALFRLEARKTYPVLGLNFEIT